MSTFANLQEYGIGPGMGYKRGVVVTVVVEDEKLEMANPII